MNCTIFNTISVLVYTLFRHYIETGQCFQSPIGSEFKKRNECKLQLDSWVDTSLLADNNNVNHVLHRGFSFLPQCLLFTTGGLNLLIVFWYQEIRVPALSHLSYFCYHRSLCSANPSYDSILPFSVL
ncbi:hypothetical protein GEMRC1_010719 [Eukaryota sp. GEM-RC1]